MANKTRKTTPKISVKIWRPIIEKFDEKIGIACIRRDAYLNKVLEVEPLAKPRMCGGFISRGKAKKGIAGGYF